MNKRKKTIKAVPPYIHPGYLNFKLAPFEAWKRLGENVAMSYYPPKCLHGAAFRWELPTLWKNKKEARLRFVEPVSLLFDMFPDYARYEIVPMFWDCWPCYFEKTCEWLRRHQVKTAIFSSRKTAERMQERFSGKNKGWQRINVIWCPEAVDDSVYQKGKLLKDRNIDLLEFGRSNDKVFKADQLESVIDKKNRNLNHVCTKQNGKFIYTNEQLYEAHAPQELIDFIGYNPVIELSDKISAEEQIADVIEHIEEYQSLVDKNRETAEKLGSWNVRIKWLMGELEKDYRLKK